MRNVTLANRLVSLFGMVCLLLVQPSTCQADENRADENQAGTRPNILFILVDDLGKEWIGCYGAEGMETPNIDALASGGMRFENMWCMPQCTPTRVTLLTGQYPYRHGWTNHFDVPRWGSGGHFDASQYQTFARVMQRAGYATAIAGKWQIDDFRVEPNALAAAGFDEWCMWTGGEGGNPISDERYWSPYVFQDQSSQVLSDRFGPDVYCEFLMDFMERNVDRPQFLYFPMCLTHGPLVATPSVPDADEKYEKHRAMVSYTDELVGRMIEKLKQLELLENTIVIFTTDNGTGGGITGRRLGHDVQGAKAKMVEAGTAIPFIVYGPGQIPSGVVTTALADFTDLLPTFAELGNAELEREHPVDGHSLAPMLAGEESDGRREWILSMGGHPARFRNNRVVPAQPYDDRVIRDERWKLWVSTDREATELYDLLNDPWEEHNLIESTDDEAVSARQRLWDVIASLPQEDAAPKYQFNPSQSWDRFEFEFPDVDSAPDRN